MISLGNKDCTAFIGNNAVNFMYLGDNLVYEKPIELTLMVYTGIYELEWQATSVDGKTIKQGVITQDGTKLQTHTIKVGYKSIISFTPKVLSGYQLGSYPNNIEILEDQTLEFFPNVSTYSVYIQYIYGNTVQSAYNSPFIGQISYTFNDVQLTISNGITLTSTYGKTITINNVIAQAGFKYNKIEVNGTSSSLNQTITIVKNTTIKVYFDAIDSYSSISFKATPYATTVNQLRRNGYTVTMTVYSYIGSHSAGAIFATIPDEYKPKTNVTFYNVNGDKWPGSKTTINDLSPTYTCTTDGNILSNIASLGSFNISGGGKWGGGTITIRTLFDVQCSWKVC